MTYDSSLKELVRGPKPALFQQYTFYVPVFWYMDDSVKYNIMQICSLGMLTGGMLFRLQHMV